MQPAKRIVFVAGEESGDIHAASVIRDLKAQRPQLHISGIGGKHMKNAGAELICDLARFGVTGLTDVLKHFAVIRRAFKIIKAHLRANKPDLLILVDYPGFNLRLAKFAKRTLGIRIIYYISPQIWAWKANRIKSIRQYVAHMAVIFPFEKEIYQKAGVPVSFVGHPLVAKMQDLAETKMLRMALNLPANKRIIAMLPGSRSHEIERHMPILKKTADNLARHFIDLHFVIPIASTINVETIKNYFQDDLLQPTFIQGKAVEVAACSDCIIVASGTASLECALLEKPMCIIYKTSRLSYSVAVQVIRVKYLGLCNLLQNKMIVPELVQDDCNADELSKIMTCLIEQQEPTQQIKINLQRLKSSLSLQQADCTLTELIESELNYNPLQ